MLGKIFSSLGIGGAKIDLVLPKNSFYAGETVNGVLHVRSGGTDQKINGIYLHLVAESVVGDYKIVKEVDIQNIAFPFMIKGGQPEFELGIQYSIPENVPITTKHTSLYILTGLDITSSIDPKDTDPVIIHPGPRVKTVMEAFERLGLKKNMDDYGRFNGKFQEFEYIPLNGFSNKIKEVDIIYQPVTDGVVLLTEFEKKSLFREMLDLDSLAESRFKIFLPNEYLSSVSSTANELGRILAQSI